MQTTETSAIPRWNRQQHPDPEASRRLHLTEHRDPAGVEEPCAVFIDPADETGPLSICIDLKVDLGIEQALAVAKAITELVDRVTPASPEQIGIVEQVIEQLPGLTYEGLAADLEVVDPENPTRWELSQMTRRIGERMRG